jgi:hypothetical protein
MSTRRRTVARHLIAVAPAAPQPTVSLSVTTEGFTHLVADGLRIDSARAAKELLDRVRRAEAREAAIARARRRPQRAVAHLMLVAKSTRHRGLRERERESTRSVPPARRKSEDR